MARDLDAIAARLRAAVPMAAELTTVTPLSTGHSNETYLLGGTGLVLRLPPSHVPLVASAHSVPAQARILQALHGRVKQAPVPAVRQVETDAAVIGDPFFLMDWTPGRTLSEYAVEDWIAGAEDDVRATVMGGFVDAIVAVHQHGELELLGAPVSNAAELDRWRSVATDADSDRLLRCFDALGRARPAPAGPPTLLHGDPKPHNGLFADDGHLSALLDWEMSYNGDPRWDLGYLLIFFESPVHQAQPGCDLPGMPTRAQVIEQWERGTGRSASDLEWFEAAATAKVAALLAYGVCLGQQGRTTDERLRAWGPVADQLATQAEAETAAALT
jgi:aminoglycoside phosphotransferase (APT) family kinase protein